jgi:diguanylate cyclase (GGDEF)-like protein
VEEIQDAQIGLLEWELEERDTQHGIEPLTGARRREVLVRALDQSLKRIHGEGEHRGEGISLIFIDLDRFKQVNDTHGHLTGDKVLQKIAGLLQGAIRGTDMLARYGGDEFAVFLPNTNEEHALRIAEKLRAALADDPELKDLGITGSFGVCSSDVSTATDSKTFIKQADEATYLSKRAGGNKVEAYK